VKHAARKREVEALKPHCIAKLAAYLVPVAKKDARKEG